jgi:hypothetical protein
VPTGLRWVAHFRDASGERSYFWDNNAVRGESSVHPSFREIDDPRVPTEFMGRVGPDNQTPVWAQRKYPTRSDDFIIGKWQEARLIAAEILIDQGQTAQAVGLARGRSRRLRARPRLRQHRGRLP